MPKITLKQTNTSITVFRTATSKEEYGSELELGVRRFDQLSDVIESNSVASGMVAVYDSSQDKYIVQYANTISDATVNGSLSANGSNGTSGQILASNGSGVYWKDDEKESSNVAIAMALIFG